MNECEQFMFYFRKLNKIDKLILAGKLAKRYKKGLIKKNDEIVSFKESCALCEHKEDCKEYKKFAE